MKGGLAVVSTAGTAHLCDRKSSRSDSSASRAGHPGSEPRRLSLACLVRKGPNARIASQCSSALSSGVEHHPINFSFEPTRSILTVEKDGYQLQSLGQLHVGALAKHFAAATARILFTLVGTRDSGVSEERNGSCDHQTRQRWGRASHVTH